MLEPLIEVAIAASSRRGPGLSLLLVAPADDEDYPDFVVRLTSQADAAFAYRPRIRYGETGLAVLFCATDPAAARSEVADLAALAESEGLRVCCGFAILGAKAGSPELIVAAEASLILAQRVGAGTIVG
jgi:hypothetical protein